MVLQMYFKYFTLLCVLNIIFFCANSKEESQPKFRILAPQFICGSDPSNETVEENPGQTSIRFQTPSNQRTTFNWNVRFNILVFSPTQRFTLMVWNVVRDLQKRLNAAASDIERDKVVVINNTALLAGVDYQFLVWATSDSDPEMMSDVQQFALSYKQDQKDPTLSVEDADDDRQMSLVLVGSDETFAHIPYILEAQVTPCQPTDDYYFMWLVKSLNTKSLLQTDYKRTKVLTIPAYTLVGGNLYEISCEIIKLSDGKFITRAFLAIHVKIRGLSVVLNVATLTVEVGNSINLTALATNYDNLPGAIDYEWTCNYSGEPCDHLYLSGNESLILEDGFSEEGRYELAVCARVFEEEATARVIILAVSAAPLIGIGSGARDFNEQQCICIDATVSRLLPGCTLKWQYVEGDQETNSNTVHNLRLFYDNFATTITDSLSIISLEENFLSELADYNNVTEEKNFPLMVCPLVGHHKYQLEIQCVCTASFECAYDNTTNLYAQVDVHVNKAPVVKGISIKPPIAYALQTPVLVSTTAAEDEPSDYPLTYKFKYKVGNGEDVTVATYVELSAAQIILPLSESEIRPIIEVCDVWGACSSIVGSPVTVLPPEGNNFEINYLSMMYSQIHRGDFIEFSKTARALLCTLQVMKMNSSHILSTLQEYLNSANQKEQNITLDISDLMKNENC